MPYEYRRRGRFGEILGNVAAAVFLGAFVFGLFALAVQTMNGANRAAFQNGTGSGGMLSNVDVRTVVMPVQTFGGFGASPRGRESSSCGYDPYGASQNPYFIYERPSTAPCPYCGRSSYESRY